MARPPLAMGTHGSITITKRATCSEKRPNGRTTNNSYVARCRFRDFDGVTRSIKRSGPSKAAASRALQDEVRARAGSPAAPLRPYHTFERAAELWLAKLDAQVAEGTRAVTTADTYRQRLRSVVLPAIGQWRLRECTIPQLDGFFTGLVATAHGPQSRKTIRTVVSLILRLAVQHEAIPDNPVRHLDPIEGGVRKPRALTSEERRQFLTWMTGTSESEEEARAQARARRRDLPDLVTFMLGTGVRMGEALGVRWCDLDLEGVPVVEGDNLRAVPIVAITGNVVRHRGKGLHRHAGKTQTSLRIVPLPQFVVSMLHARVPFGPEAPVFPAASSKGAGVSWKDPNNICTYIREARQAAGMDWSVTSHTFRKTAATIWHDAGVLTDRQKADLTGHAKISTLTDVYVARGELHPQAAAVMDAAWLNT